MPPNQLAMITAKHTMPMTGVMNISSAGRMEMNAMDTPASVPNRAARGVMRRITGAMNAPIMSTKLWMNTHVSPASQPLMGSPVESEIGSITTNVTMNMCGTLMPD